MRIARLALIGSIAALAVAAAPAPARNAVPPQKTEDKSSPASCHAYQMAPDGSWTVLPCQEAGGQTEHKPAKGGEETPR
jgi:hypothetical protein